MRIAVVSVARQKGVPEYVKSLVKGMDSMGHRVDVLDAWTDEGMRLPGYEYIAICAEKSKFFSGKLPEVLTGFIGAGSGLMGKKSAAFVKKSGFMFMSKALANLMKAMEKEGMRINWSDTLFNPPHAEAMGKHIGA